MRGCCPVGLCLLLASLLPAADRATLNGRVVEATGKPLDHATVFVYNAGVKKGFSTFCPSCYADCGKRAVARADGSYSITGLDSELWFELLAVKNGYLPTFLKKADPSAGEVPAAMLARRIITTSASVVRGRVVDEQGRTLPGTVLELKGVSTLNNQRTAKRS